MRTWLATPRFTSVGLCGSKRGVHSSPHVCLVRGTGKNVEASCRRPRSDIFTEGVFGIPDTEGAFFGTRGSKDDFRRNVDLLRQFFKGNYKLAQDPEAEEFRKKSWEEKFKYALEHETAGNAISSDMGGERGTTLGEKIFSLAWMEVAAGDPDRAKEHEARAGDIARRGNYETMTPEEKHAYEADVIGEGFAPGVRPTARPTRTLRESRPSPRRSLQDVTSHSPRQNQTQQAKPPRRRAIPT